MGEGGGGGGFTVENLGRGGLYGGMLFFSLRGGSSEV